MGRLQRLLCDVARSDARAGRMGSVLIRVVPDEAEPSLK
jgi:hypothetical protein